MKMSKKFMLWANVWFVSLDSIKNNTLCIYAVWIVAFGRDFLEGSQLNSTMTWKKYVEKAIGHERPLIFLAQAYLRRCPKWMMKVHIAQMIW